jgi:hypothetical protein
MNPIGVPRIASHQQDLFPLEDAPDGLSFEPEIMTAKEEAAFLDVIKTLPFGNFRMHGVDAKRRVVRFGVHYVAGSAAMLPAAEFPVSLEPLRARAAAVAGIPTRVLSEALVTEYTAGAGIAGIAIRHPSGSWPASRSVADAGCAFNGGKGASGRPGHSSSRRDPSM